VRAAGWGLCAACARGIGVWFYALTVKKPFVTQGVSTQFIYRELLKQIVKMFETRELPIDPRETLEIVAFIEARKKAPTREGSLSRSMW